MRTLRNTLERHRQFALFFAVLALTFKAVVPSGFMIETRALTLTIAICADASGGHLTRQIVIPRDSKPTPSDPAKGSAACPFASLGLGLPTGELLAVAAAALAFIMLVGLSPTRPPRLRRPEFLRPPLRAPPTQA